MIIDRNIDIEYEVTQALNKYQIGGQTYLRPLPENYSLPNILVSQVGGSDFDQIDHFDVVLDSRAENEGEATILLNNAIGVLKQVAKEQTTALRYIEVVSSGSWGNDPVRPDLAMRSARLRITAHLEKTEIQISGGI